MASRQAINYLFSSFSQFMGGSSLSGSGNAGWSAPLSAGHFIAKGDVFDSGNIVPFARGDVVTGPTLFPMARGMGLMGEAGPEAVMPLRRGADGKLGVAGGGTAINMQVMINNNAANDVDVNPRQDSGPDGERLVIEIVKKAHARGEFDPSNSSLYGLRRRKVR
jgi:lambda family phage tail tape measure protein